MDPRATRPFLRPGLIGSWREITGVLFLLLLPFIVTSAIGAWHGSQAHYVQAFLTNRILLLNGAAEAAILGLGLVYFHRRGWTPGDLRIRPGIVSSLQGIALIPLTLLANGLVVVTLLWIFFLCQHQQPSFPAYVLASNPQISHIHVDLSWSVLIVAMFLNAFLEEVVCTAYAFTQFASKLGPAPGLALTVLLRALCHIYQGPVHALGIAMVFLILTLWYWRTRNLWTLIFAHALIDLSSLGALKVMSH